MWQQGLWYSGPDPYELIKELEDLVHDGVADSNIRGQIYEKLDTLYFTLQKIISKLNELDKSNDQLLKFYDEHR